MMASEGGNIGFQIGVQATDFVIMVMNDRGARSLLTNKVKLGADPSIAAGPVGLHCRSLDQTVCRPAFRA